MKVQDIMTAEVVTIGPDVPFKELVETLVRSEVSCLPVVGEQHQLIGIVTEADLISKEAYGTQRHRALAVLADLVTRREHEWVAKAAGSTAADVMTSEVVVCEPGEDVRVVARRMLERRVKRLPVVRDGSLLGIVSRQDILSMFARSDDAIAADVERALSSGLNLPDDQHVGFVVEAGVVTLRGDVRYAWDEPIVVSTVRDVAGVIEVVSRIHHRAPNPPSSSTPWIGGPMRSD